MAVGNEKSARQQKAEDDSKQRNARVQARIDKEAAKSEAQFQRWAARQNRKRT